MTSGSGFNSGSGDDGSPSPRLVVFPRFSLPHGVALGAGVAFFGAVVLVLVSGAIQAFTYRVALPSVSGLQQLPTGLRQPSLGFADRLGIFTRTTNLTVAFVVVVGIVMVAMVGEVDQQRRSLPSKMRAMILVGAVLACIIALANLVLCVEVLRNNVGQQFSSTISRNRAANVVQLLAPVGLSVGVIWYTAVLLRWQAPAARSAESKQEGP